jgi:hypothetical protein
MNAYQTMTNTELKTTLIDLNNRINCQDEYLSVLHGVVYKRDVLPAIKQYRSMKVEHPDFNRWDAIYKSKDGFKKVADQLERYRELEENTLDELDIEFTKATNERAHRLAQDNESAYAIDEHEQYVSCDNAFANAVFALNDNVKQEKSQMNF